MKTTLRVKWSEGRGLVIIDDLEDGSQILATRKEAENLIEKLQEILEESE